jgi:hypothetical protein
MTCQRDDQGNFLNLDDDDDDDQGGEATLRGALIIHQMAQSTWEMPTPFRTEAAFYAGVASVLDLQRAYPSDFMARVRTQHDEAFGRFSMKMAQLMAQEREHPPHLEREEMRLVARWDREGDDNDWHELRHDGSLYWVWKENAHGSMPERVVNDTMAIGIHQGAISSLNALNYGSCPELRRTHP